jgi:hypothetical protein
MLFLVCGIVLYFGSNHFTSLAYFRTEDGDSFFAETLIPTRLEPFATTA